MVYRLRFILLAGLFGIFFLLFVPLAKAANCYLYSNAIGYVCSADNTLAGLQMFATPLSHPDTVFGRVYYGRLADNTNVYPSPSRDVAPLHNMGDGYIFVTVRSWAEVNGATWYEINYGEYVHEDDIQLATPSPFQGVEVKQQPQRPFGWVVQAVQPSSEPGSEPNPVFSELPRYTFFEIYEAVQLDDGWIWYRIDEGVWIRQTYVSVVEVSPRPEGVGPNEFWTEVDLYEQTFAAYEGDRMVYASLISSGLNRWPTREGLFQVWDRWERYKMSGAEGKVDYYFLEDIPYIMYFDELNGIALHGTYWHDRFGYKHSHGCVNMPIKDAEWVFRWSENAPNDLWVWVHTSNATSHLTQ